MRSGDNRGDYHIATEVTGQRVKLVLTALDEQGDFKNFIAPVISGIGPDSQPVQANFRQKAPGRYEAVFDTQSSGPYFLAIAPDAQSSLLRVGVNVETSDEFLHRTENIALLKEMASLQPEGGEPGQVYELDLQLAQATESSLTPYRRDLPRSQQQRSIWELLLVACGCLFWIDIAQRRIRPDFSVISRWLQNETSANETPDRLQALDRLKRQKATQREQYAPSHASFAAATTQTEASPEVETPNNPMANNPPQAESQPDTDDNNYLDRLLKTKRQATTRLPDRED